MIPEIAISIQRIRIGWATNSNSAHSIIFWGPVLPPEDVLFKGTGNIFGWCNFVLAIPSAKPEYFCSAVVDTLKSPCDNSNVDDKHNDIESAVDTLLYHWSKEEK